MNCVDIVNGMAMHSASMHRVQAVKPTALCHKANCVPKPCLCKHYAKKLVKCAAIQRCAVLTGIMLAVEVMMSA